jgi:hypothetical protein
MILAISQLLYPFYYPNLGFLSSFNDAMRKWFALPNGGADI